MASLVFLWLGLPFVFASTVILFFALRHDENEGPLSTHAQHQRDQIRRDVEAAGGTFNLPPNRNVDGYHDGEKFSEDNGENGNGAHPNEASIPPPYTNGRPSEGTRT